MKQPVLVNGNLVIHDFPCELQCTQGAYIVYRITQHDQAWFWKICFNQISAVVAARECFGRIIKVNTFERSNPK